MLREDLGKQILMNVGSARKSVPFVRRKRFRRIKNFHREFVRELIDTQIFRRLNLHIVLCPLFSAVCFAAAAASRDIER